MEPQADSATPAPRVLLIDDEAPIRKFVDISLRAQGYGTLLAADGGQGLALLASRGADLVVLDLGLPDRDGREVLQELRQWSGVPVIVLTVRDDEQEKVALLDAGANDYVTKPFGIAELMARVRALLRVRPTDRDASPAYDDGVLRVDLAQRQVLLRGAPLTLTRKEFALLAALVRQPGRLLTQRQLLRDLWGPAHAEDAHYLRILVSRLRHKLDDDAAAPRWIITEPGVGLRFAPPAPPAPPAG
jgi:two-component system KDP operon response regulator KdpE